MFKFCGINCFYNYKQVLQKKKKTQTANNLIFLPFIYVTSKIKKEDFPSGTVFKNPPAKAGDTGSSPGLGRSHLLWSNGGPTPRPLGPCSRAHAPGACVPEQEEPLQGEVCALQPRAAPAHLDERKPAQRDRDTAKPDK